MLASITNALKQYPGNDRYSRPPPPPGAESLVSSALAAAQRRQRESAGSGAPVILDAPPRRLPSALSRGGEGPSEGRPLEAVRESKGATTTTTTAQGQQQQGTWAAGRSQDPYPSPGDTIRTTSDIGTLGRSMSLPAQRHPREEPEEGGEEVEEEPGIEGPEAAGWTAKGSSGNRRESDLPPDEVPDEEGVDSEAEEAAVPPRRPGRPWGAAAGHLSPDSAGPNGRAGTGAGASSARGHAPHAHAHAHEAARRAPPGGARYWRDPEEEDEDDAPLLETPAAPPALGLDGTEPEPGLEPGPRRGGAGGSSSRGTGLGGRPQGQAPGQPVELSLLYDPALGVYFDPKTNRHYALKT